MLLRELYLGTAAYPHCDSRFRIHIQFVVRCILMFEQSEYLRRDHAFWFSIRDSNIHEYITYTVHRYNIH